MAERLIANLALMCALASASVGTGAEEWHQFKYDAHHSGNVPQREITTPLGLIGAVPLSDAIFTSPVIADGRIYAVDGSGVAFCIDETTLEVVWKQPTAGGAANCNCVSSPTVAGSYLHFGTTAGRYYVLERKTGTIVKETRSGGPIFTTPVVSGDRVYYTTVGRVFAVEHNGDAGWQWDFVREVMGFEGDRWNGRQWQQHKQGRVTWRDHFCSSRNLAAHGRTIVVPAGGRTVFLEDEGPQAKLRAVGEIPAFAGKEYAAAFGQSLGPSGEVYVQWHRRDNAGRVEILKLEGNNVTADHVASTQTAIHLPGLLSFASVSVRDGDIYRCRPEEGFGFCRHTLEENEPQRLGAYPSITSPILLKNQGIVGGLDGRLYVVPLSGSRPTWSFATAFGCAISAPPAICNGRIYFGCEDGYLYVLGPGGKAPRPTKDLKVNQIRTPLRGKFAGAEHDWYTNYGNLAGTNHNDQGIQPPLKLKWIRRYEGTFKHLPICGGGRMYTHTSEGQIFAVEQDTGRLLWRRYWPGVYLSFTAPIYYRYKGREWLLLPQAGMQRSRMRCLDAATGEMMWEAPFTGSPSWSRQAAPVIHENVAIYASGSGRYAAQGTERAFVMKGDPRPDPNKSEIMSWIYSHNNPYYPRDNRPLIWAWDLDTGKVVWTKDLSEYGSGGNDCGLCLMEGRLYYSTFFGYSADQQRRRGLPGKANGLTAAMDPSDGKIIWLTTDYSVTAGCSISGSEGRLYLGGYNRPHEGTQDRYVFCLDARDGSLVWRSDPVRSAVNVVTVADDFIFSNASGNDGHVIDKDTGKILSKFNFGYACTRFTCSGPYVMGANMDMIDLANDNQLASTGPCIDSRECMGSTVSNGRVFYTSQASGLQVSLIAGEDAESYRSPWEE